MKIFLFMAMARSGSHTVINWICKNYPGSIIHKNNCIRGWEGQKMQPWSTAIKRYGKEPWDAQLLNFEWFDMDDINKFKMKEFQMIRENKIHWVLLLRDPFNWLASSMRHGSPNLDNPWVDQLNRCRESGIDLYKKQMRVACKKPALSGISRMTVINYNRWFSDIIYRGSVAAQLGINDTDKGTAGISRFGGGSSFDKFKDYDGHTQDMEVLSRWRHYQDNPKYRRMFDRELCEMSSNFFGFCPIRIEV